VRADNTSHLLRAARDRSDRTQAAALQAIDELAASGQLVTVASLSKAADVSRSWIYTQPDLLRQIEAISERSPSEHRPASPSDQRATTASLHRRLELAHARINQLATENGRLRDEVARLYGTLRNHQGQRNAGDEAPHLTAGSDQPRQ
jgi:hypothetical protein